MTTRALINRLLNIPSYDIETLNNHIGFFKVTKDGKPYDEPFVIVSLSTLTDIIYELVSKENK